MGPRGNVVYMLAGGLRIYDTASGEERELQIQLPSDRDLTRRRNTSAEPYLTWASISPEGDRVLYVTRGEIFSVPVEEGVTLPVHPGSDARESWASFGPDGERVVYVTDESGEEAIVTADAWGRGEEEVVVPAGENGWHFPPLWSPDGDWIAWSDDNQDLYISAADGKETRKVAHAEQDEIREYTWSADGRWLAYTLIDRREFGTVYVYSVKDQTSTAVTGPNTHDHSPAWDPEGRYLYFLSDRFINPMMGGRDFQYIAHGASAELFALPLNAEAENPVLETAGAPPPDLTRREERKAAREEKKEEKEDKKREEKGEAKDVVIELEGIVGRAIKLPVEPGNYGTVAATADAVFFLSAPVRGMADGGWDEEGIPDSDLMKYDLEEKEADVFIEGVSGYELALGREHLMLMRAGQIAVVGTGGGSFEDDGVDLSGVVVALDPLEEWRQIYWEAWRHMRDFHWDQEMTGLDWEAIGARYAELLPRLSTRDDLRDVIGELIGELATSHTYVWGGDNPRRMSGSNIGLLGADLVREGAAWRVERIYRGDPADGVRSPLDIHGVDVAEGDYLLAINNQPFDPALPYTTSLLGLAGKPVLLTVSDTADGADPRQVVVTPMGTEWQLRYADWVRENREYVAAQTDGKIGYLHIPDMGGWGLIQFDRWFFPQLDKEGLVVDVRWNGGGFVSQMILERLRREVLHFDRSRGGGVWTYPYKSLNGPWVVLTNEHAGSDGDIFPASVQLEGLAPVIGMRSWGGVVGIRGDKQLTDGGGLTQPEYAFWLPGQGWALENRGVIPDIEVQNLPQELGRGEDAQLDRAIEEVLRLHEEEPPKVPEFGPAPDKSREAFKKELEE
jgi:tricorn protease